MKARTARNSVDALRVVQVVLAVTILGITIKLLLRYQHLRHGCGQPGNKGVPHSSDPCDVVDYFLGALKFCIVPPILSLCDVMIWVIDSYVTGMPWVFIHWAAWFIQAFYMGGATTLAARINNNWKCEAPYLCNLLHTDIAFMFVALLVTWSIIVLIYRLKREYPAPN